MPMRLGEAFSLLNFVGMPAEPDKRMMKCVTGEVTVYELILRVAEYEGQDIAVMREALSHDAQAKNVMHLALGFDAVGDPNRGTLIETIIARYALQFWMDGTVQQTPDHSVHDWLFLPPCPGQNNGDALEYILWLGQSLSGRQPNAWAPKAQLEDGSLNWTKWECKTGSAYYEFKSGEKPKGGKRYAYTYVRTVFYFDANQVTAIDNGHIQFIVLVFLDRKNRHMRAILVPAARLQSTDQHGEPSLSSKKDGSATLEILGNRLPNDPARLSATGVRMLATYPDDRESPNPTPLPVDATDASRAPLRRGDLDRVIERCLPGTHSYDAFAVAELGEICG
jgi:hypothetical protein